MSGAVVNADPPFAGRQEFGVVRFKGAIYVYGGIKDGTFYDDGFRSNDDGRNWVALPRTTPLWSPRANFLLAADSNFIFLAGGYTCNGLELQSDFWVSADGTSWQQHASGNLNFGVGPYHGYGTSTVLDGKMYVQLGCVQSSSVCLGGCTYTNSLGAVDLSTRAVSRKNIGNWYPRAYAKLTATAQGSLLFGAGQESRTWNQRADVWRSTDGGASWTEVDVPWLDRHRRMYTVDGRLSVWAYDHRLEYFSTDDGLTWMSIDTVSDYSISISAPAAVLPAGAALDQSQRAKGYFFVWVEGAKVSHVWLECMGS